MTLLLCLLSILAFSALSKKYPEYPVKFDPERGFHDSPFNLTLSYDNAVVIRYVVYSGVAQTASNDPTFTSGSQYTGPILISKTCFVKAIAYTLVNGFNVASNLTTHSFLFFSDISKQASLDTAYLATFPVADVKKGFLSIPSIVINSNLTYPTEICYGDCDPLRFGEIEFLDPKDDSNHFHKFMQYFRRGGYSRNYPKKSFKIEFKDFLPGGDTLEFDLFVDKKFPAKDGSVRPAYAQKKFVLRSSSDNSFTADICAPPLYIRGIWNDYFNHELGLILPHSRLVYYFFNNQLQGVLTLREILTEDMLAEYLGANSSDFESADNGDGGGPVFSSLIVNPKKWTFLRDWVDIESMFAMYLSVHFTCNFDNGVEHNWFFAGPTKPKPFLGKNGGWKFFMHDNDVATTYDLDRWPGISGLHGDNINGETGVYNMFLLLISEGHPEFMLRFYDSQHKLFFRKNAIMRSTRVVERFQDIYNAFQLNYSLILEMARWGTTPRTCDNVAPNTCGWNANGFSMAKYHVGWNWIINTWAPQRQAIFVEQYRARGWLTPIPAVVFSVDDYTVVEPNHAVTITATAGYQIAYTLNGEDPYVTGNSLNPNAKLAASPLTLRVADTTKIRARQNAGTNWGPIDEVNVIVNVSSGCVLCGKVIISEVMYHYDKLPNIKGNAPNGDFVEIKNIANVSVVLTGSTIEEMHYTFPVLTLQPGQLYVIANYYEDFKMVYNVYPNDTYTGYLGSGKSGDKYTIRDPMGRKVFRLEYKTVLPWSQYPDGLGYSLVADAQQYSTIATDEDGQSYKYRYSTARDGSPFRDDPTPNWKQRDLVVQFSFVSFEKDWIEFYNPSKVDIDLSDWAIYNNGKIAKTIPGGTIIYAQSKLKVKDVKLKRTRTALYRYDHKLSVYSGDYVHFRVEDNELAYR